MIEFGKPVWLWGLLILPVVAAAMAIGVRRRHAALSRFVGPALQDRLAPGASWRRHLAKGVLRVTALAMVFLSLAQPRFGSQLVKVERQGIDLVIAVDVSLSMMAEDVAPNRLERAKREIADLIGGLQGDRVGLVVFAGQAVPLCPLTVDYNAALMLARSIDVYSVSEPGTAIADAIEKSTAMFEGAQGGDRAVILITDGENQQGDPEQAAKAAAEKGIRIYTVGLGSPKGELIPERGTDGTVTGYKKDAKGETVLSRLDETTLQKVAAATGGQYLPATSEGLEIKVLYDAISGMQRKLIKGEFVERKKERFIFPLAAAFLCLLVDALLSTRGFRGRGTRTRALHTGLAALFLVAMAGTAVPAHAGSVKGGKVRSGNKLYRKGDYGQALSLYRQALGDTTHPPENAQGVYYNSGNALFMQQKYDQALEEYQRAYAVDSTLTGRMLYNRGNALLKSGKPGPAVESYIQALNYLPDDPDARHNLEMALAAKQQQQQQQKKNKNNKDQNKGDQKQQSQDSQSNPDSSQTQPQQGDQQQQKPDSTQQNSHPQPDSTQSLQQPDSTQSARPDSSSTPLTEDQLRKLSPEDAMRILQALQDREQELQKERRKAAFRKLKRSGKDW